MKKVKLRYKISGTGHYYKYSYLIQKKGWIFWYTIKEFDIQYSDYDLISYYKSSFEEEKEIALKKVLKYIEDYPLMLKKQEENLNKHYDLICSDPIEKEVEIEN